MKIPFSGNYSLSGFQKGQIAEFRLKTGKIGDWSSEYKGNGLKFENGEWDLG